MASDSHNLYVMCRGTEEDVFKEWFSKVMEKALPISQVRCREIPDNRYYLCFPRKRNGIPMGAAYIYLYDKEVFTSIVGRSDAPAESDEDWPCMTEEYYAPMSALPGLQLEAFGIRLTEVPIIQPAFPTYRDGDPDTTTLSSAELRVPISEDDLRRGIPHIFHDPAIAPEVAITPKPYTIRLTFPTTDACLMALYTLRRYTIRFGDTTQTLCFYHCAR